jgi:hypothetical protein
MRRNRVSPGPARAALLFGLTLAWGSWAAAAPAGAAPTGGSRPAAVAAGMDLSADVVFRALSLLGVPYRWGGNTPEDGLDCSGLVRLVFEQTAGVSLPRRSVEISQVGGDVPREALQPGDLVFFNTLRYAFSHVGIYIGNGQFVHAPSRGKPVRVDSLAASYWTRRFDGARRLLDAPAHAWAPGVAQGTTAGQPGAAPRTDGVAGGALLASVLADLEASPPPGASRASPATAAAVRGPTPAATRPNARARSVERRQPVTSVAARSAATGLAAATPRTRDGTLYVN